ncbi:bacterial low temperature requirement A protein-domain-containing protein [Lophiotrema nucula]|uniref:Bacterial low temperature requirement A protein-domain-containing protein n=1 Tax=Lophiotrema nucula TaxID=690887 RepID=A0A6A5ZP31_9PLEO|nr:bacterial low temperature requirement A protein-domain-containing protein [Lophiotrema nucula]
MGHEEHHHEEKKPLGIFSSPLNTHGHSHAVITPDSDSLEQQKTANTENVPFENQDCELHDNPAFHRHAEATTAELFYDLFFVANLTTFTSGLEINDKNSLTAYIGFFSLLWLTWYQVSLYDVRFSSDSVFERVAKGLHFGVMVGFAVIGVQWKPGQEVDDYKIYKAFGLILMVSRLTLVAQYSVTLFYTKKYKKTIFPIAMIIVSSLVAAILYGALTAAFPKVKEDTDGFLIPVKSNVYIAWYIIGILEVLITVSVSSIWRVISFKGTHMVQRMSLLTLIILGEGIIVICKSISKIVKNEFLWTAAVVGQIIAAVTIIYFLYMLYFDRMQEEHFGSIKQQIWSFLHFPLHVVLVLVLQGISILIVWRQAVDAFNNFNNAFIADIDAINSSAYATGQEFAEALYNTTWGNVFDWVPKGVDASVEKATANGALVTIAEQWDFVDGTNTTAESAFEGALFDLITAASKTLFDSLSISTPKKKEKGSVGKDAGGEDKAYMTLMSDYAKVIELVFMYVFLAGGFALLLTTTLAFLSLPARQRRPSEYARLGFNFLCGIGLCLITLIKYNTGNEADYITGSWMIPTLCIVLFVCVIVGHVRVPGRKRH